MGKRLEMEVSWKLKMERIRERMVSGRSGRQASAPSAIKGRSLRRRKDLQLGHSDLDAARGDILVDSTLATRTYSAVSSNYVFCVAALCLLKHGTVGVVVKGKLQKTRAVAQIDEAERAKVAAALHPAHYADLLAHVALIQHTAIVGALVLFGQKFSHLFKTPFIRSLRRLC
jgi:hypothetical protein